MKTNQDYQIIVKTHAGLEQVLAEELKNLGCESPEILKRAVSVHGHDNLLYKINYQCSTALRVLKVLDSFHFSDNQGLYDAIKKMPWETYLRTEGTLAVEAIESHSIFNNTHFIARFVKDAIVDKFREKFDKRPHVDLENPDVFVNIHIHKDFCTVSLDSSQVSLHKRGYRKANIEAPVNEVTAAGIIRLSGWQGETDFYDPMCGSGTLIIEAAMFAMNMPSGYFRNTFGFQKWLTFDKAAFNRVVEEANNGIRKYSNKIYGSDIAIKNIRIADENIRFAKLHNEVLIKKADFFSSLPPFFKGTIITNPPYGERLKLDSPEDFYKNFGNTLKRNYAGYTAWLFSQNNDALKHIGLKPSRKITLYNGKIECKLMKFDLYEGKRVFDNKITPA